MGEQQDELISYQPKLLYFKPPYNESCDLRVVLTARNVQGGTVAFKFRTSNPERYAVRPHHVGMLQPGQEVALTVGYRPKLDGGGGVAEENMPRSSQNDRFQIEARLLPADKARSMLPPQPDAGAAAPSPELADVFRQQPAAGDPLQRSLLFCHFGPEPPAGYTGPVYGDAAGDMGKGLSTVRPGARDAAAFRSPHPGARRPRGDDAAAALQLQQLQQECGALEQQIREHRAAAEAPSGRGKKGGIGAVWLAAAAVMLGFAFWLGRALRLAALAAEEEALRREGAARLAALAAEEARNRNWLSNFFSGE